MFMVGILKSMQWILLHEDSYLISSQGSVYICSFEETDQKIFCLSQYESIMACLSLEWQYLSAAANTNGDLDRMWFHLRKDS
jgi:hypothetical protein